MKRAEAMFWKGILRLAESIEFENSIIKMEEKALVSLPMIPFMMSINSVNEWHYEYHQ